MTSVCARMCDVSSRPGQEMERVVLGTLRWDVAGVTPQDFIPHFLSCLEELMGNSEDAADFVSTLRRHGDTLAAMCVCDSRFLGTRPSLVAAAALNSALRGLEAKRRREMSHMTCTLATLCRSDPVSGRGNGSDSQFKKLQ